MAILHVKTPNGVTKAYDLDKMGGIPVGFEHFSMNPNVPQGWLPLLGGLYDRATYPDLWAWVQAQSGYCKTEAQWQELSAAHNGNVPFYSDGDGSTTFRVPSLKCWVKSANGTVSEVGSYLEAGLPNIDGEFGTGTNGYYVPIRDGASGAFSNAGYSTFNTANANGGSTDGYQYAEFHASSSNSIYGNSTTVQPESIVGLWLVKAYGTIEETGTINEQQYIDDRFAQAKAYTDSHISVVGSVQAYAGSTIPTGWLFCDGSAISRITYSALFDVIGTTYGDGDGSTTFNLPNLTDRVIEGHNTVGSYRGSGLPNIVGYFSLVNNNVYFNENPAQTSGAFSAEGWVDNVANYEVVFTGPGKHMITFDANRSTSIYGASNRVQPESLTMRYIIKY